MFKTFESLFHTLQVQTHIYPVNIWRLQDDWKHYAYRHHIGNYFDKIVDIKVPMYCLLQFISQECGNFRITSMKWTNKCYDGSDPWLRPIRHNYMNQADQETNTVSSISYDSTHTYGYGVIEHALAED